MPLIASASDIEMWEDNGREDILAWVDAIVLEGVVCSYDIWIDPESGEDALSCPWLRKITDTEGYQCSIHTVKPEVCRKFPTSRKHAEDVGCPGVKANR